MRGPDPVTKLLDFWPSSCQEGLAWPRMAQNGPRGGGRGEKPMLEGRVAALGEDLGPPRLLLL